MKLGLLLAIGGFGLSALGGVFEALPKSVPLASCGLKPNLKDTLFTCGRSSTPTLKKLQAEAYAAEKAVKVTAAALEGAMLMAAAVPGAAETVTRPLLAKVEKARKAAADAATAKQKADDALTTATESVTAASKVTDAANDTAKPPATTDATTAETTGSECNKINYLFIVSFVVGVLGVVMMFLGGDGADADSDSDDDSDDE